MIHPENFEMTLIWKDITRNLLRMSVSNRNCLIVLTFKGLQIWKGNTVQFYIINTDNIDDYSTFNFHLFSYGQNILCECVFKFQGRVHPDNVRRHLLALFLFCTIFRFML